MKLYNTATKKIEDFKPINPEKVKIYTCGPTVYSTPHIGNYAAYVYWDLLIRTLYANNYKPYRVLNLTDVGHLTSDGDEGEDKLEKGAKKEGKTVWEIADRYIDIFKDGFEKLGLTEPVVWARATDYIEQSMDLVQKLIDNGFTYETADGLYFDTSKFPEYADFARLDLDHQKAGARVAFSDEKRNVSDFAVWKFIKPGENHAMRWDFLGRPGYPGWHLECSSIIHEELKEPIDIHTGGIDHIPVHHSNEIAETFGAYNEKLANYWLHCNFLTINGEKISKSLGNIVTLDELEEKGFSPYDFKLWLYQGHYRAERNFTWEDLSAARTRRLKWKNSYVALFQTTSKDNRSLQGQLKHSTSHFMKLKIKLLDALNNDLNSASAFALIDAELERMTLADWSGPVEALFGLNIANTDRDAEYEIIDKKLQSLFKERETARKNQDWATADRIRDELAKENLTIIDTARGPIWQFI
ncbi:cysteine--tRNA ligase [Candidatus Saccharibacteria bacterium]|nr:cysteine--tRNA ligase [Candidatus Saccharibacteria bacterium]